MTDNVPTSHKISPREREVLAYLVTHGATPKTQIYLPGYISPGPDVSGTVNALARRGLLYSPFKLRGGKKVWGVSEMGKQALEQAGGPPPVPDEPRRTLSRDERALLALQKRLKVGDFVHMDYYSLVVRYEYRGDGVLSCAGVVKLGEQDRLSADDIARLHDPDDDLTDFNGYTIERLYIARDALKGEDISLASLREEGIRSVFVVEASTYRSHYTKKLSADEKRAYEQRLREAPLYDLTERTT